MHTAADPWLAYRPVNTLEVLSRAASSLTGKMDLRLERLVLFRQRSLSPSNWLRKSTSWHMEMQAQRGGVFGEDLLHTEARLGLGRTMRILPHTYAYGLLTCTGVYHPDHGLDAAPGFEAGVMTLSSVSWRGGNHMR